MGVDPQVQGTRNHGEDKIGCKACVRLKKNERLDKYYITHWVDNHNHVTVEDDKAQHLMRQRRNVTEVVGVMASINNECGIPLRSSYEILCGHLGGEGNVGCTKVDVKNFLGKARQRKMLYGEETAINEYFREKQKYNADYFVEVEIDSEEKMTNIFWADQRMQYDYACFGDSITFYTTCRTNRHCRPLGVLMYLFYNIVSEADFGHDWNLLIKECFPSGGRTGHKWLEYIHPYRQQWSSAWVKNHYTTGMVSTQLVESCNGIIRGFLSADKTIIDFFPHFVRMVESRRRVEREAEYHSRRNKPRNNFEYSELVKKAASEYTPKMFAIFQEQFSMIHQYHLEQVPEHNTEGEPVYLV
ncbi:Protein FAR1-RELATED SEQUENCE 5 [Linum grandiflorum]